MIAVRQLIVLAAVAVAVASCGGSSGSSAPASTSRSGSDVTMTLAPVGDATAAQLAAAADVVRARLSAQEITVRTSVSGGAVQVSVPSSARAAVEAAALPGVLSFREIYTDPSGSVSTSPVASPAAEGSGLGTTVTGLDAPASESNQTTPSAATLAQFAALDCTDNDGRPSAIDEDPHHFVVACDRTGQTKYLLTPADFVGSQFASADAAVGYGPSGQSTGLWVVDITFQGSAIQQVETVSSRLFHNNMQQLAITLDGVVVSAPTTNGVLGANIAISGGNPPFSKGEAQELAAVATAGPLPIALTVRP